MRYTGLILVVLLVAVLFYLPSVSSQTITNSGLPDEENVETRVSIHAKERGFPRVSFDDGKDLSFNGENQNAESAKLLTSADFDSDGTADLITADVGGNLKFYSGNVDSVYPNSAEANRRKADGSFNNSAFYPSTKSFYLPISPGFLVAGDFNADGFSDVLAAAKNDTSLHLLAGDGAGNFAADFEIKVDGVITAFAVGEIGRRDGQTDAAIAISNKNGSYLLVFEHPEGAFKHKPEIIKLEAQANDLAIGNLDTDYFADVAAASGNKLTVVHGRGQAYPWDLSKEYNIKRPAAFSETRTLPFEIAALAVGNFTEKRGDSLAILTTTGALQTLDSLTIKKSKNQKFTEGNLQSKSRFIPSGFNSNKFAVIENDSVINAETAEEMGALPANIEVRVNFLKEKNDKLAEEMQKLSSAEQKQMTAAGTKRAEESRERAIAGFLKAISPSPSIPLVRWNLQTLVTDSRLSSAAFSPNAEKLITVRVSDSGKDELAFLDTNHKQIHILARGNNDGQTNEIISLDAETNPTAILPMRLNSDALSDLVVLREGASTPSIVMTAPANTFVVTSASDSDDVTELGGCTSGGGRSLRGAIYCANITSGADSIVFNIGGGGVQTILLTTEMSDIQSTVTIDATTQPGFSGTPLIEIKGSNLEGAADGLQVNANNVVVRGFAVNEFKSAFNNDLEIYVGGNGIAVFSYSSGINSRNNIIEGNFLGTDPTGTIDKGNDATGVNIFDSDDNLIGGTTAAARNLMSGSGTNNDGSISPRKIGVGLSVTDGKNTRIKGNYIGTNASGTGKINNSYGVYFAASNSEFGGDEAGAGNTVSGNGDPAPHPNIPDRCFGNGISEATLVNLNTGELVTYNNNYKGNRIGTTADGNSALRNCNTGLFVKPRHQAIVGSITENGRNTVSGNQEGGIYCSNFVGGIGFNAPDGGSEPPGFCDISGNNVGTNVSGTAAIPNQIKNSGDFILFFGGVVVYNTETFSNIGAPGGTTPNACTGFCNLVSGNDSEGIHRNSREGLVGMFNNYIGTNRSGTAAIPNRQGVNVLFAGLTLIGGIGVDDNDNRFSLGNLISGNSNEGISFFGPSGNTIYQYAVEGNMIGTDSSGTNAVPNGTNSEDEPSAILLAGENFITTIGAVDPLSRNIISGNASTGITISSNFPPFILNNYIGVNKQQQPLGNGSEGIEVFRNDATIQSNVIANNADNGVYVAHTVTFNGTQIQNRNNLIRFNSIYNNGGLGIDLSGDSTFPSEPDGVTPNDCLDIDEKANRLQNYPVLTSPVFNGDGTVTVGGAFQSMPSSSFAIDFYTNTASDPTNYGEGENYIGSTQVQTDGSGITTFVVTSNVQVDPNVKITATATDVDGNTSEFSCAAGVCEGGTGGLTEAELRELVTPTCLISIIVNINTDEPDANPNDGVCDVDSATSGVQCSLRAAIETANAHSGFDLINFDIPGSGIQTITPTSQLPSIYEIVLIDATTQPGYANSPVIELNGTSAGPEANGLVFISGSNNSGVIGMTINRFANAGIVFESNNNRLEKSWIGLLSDGVMVDPGVRQSSGVKITGSKNRIGARRNEGAGDNLITGNFESQILITSSTASENKVQGNNIGFDKNGDVPTGEFLSGIRISQGATKNKIGGTKDFEENLIKIPEHIGIIIEGNSMDNTVTRNAIAGCDVGIHIKESSNNVIGGEVGDGETSSRNVIGDNGIGIYIGGLDDFSPVADGKRFKGSGKRSNKKSPSRASILGTPAQNNKIYGNLIGISPNIVNFDNDYGIVVTSAERTQIGNGTFGFHNFISGNIFEGIVLDTQANSNFVRGNFIGTDLPGTGITPNRTGVQIAGSDNELDNNVISGNNDFGVLIQTLFDSDPIPSRNIINNNRIGINSDNVTVKNFGGILIDGIQNSITSNTISGNTQFGIDVRDNSNIIMGNKIGTDTTGNTAIGNEQGGIIISSSSNILRSNTISGNTRAGIYIQPGLAEPETIPALNIIQGNLIGTNSAGTFAIPNLAGGIIIINANLNLIGDFGSGIPAARNIISGNSTSGIKLLNNAANNRISGNYIGADSSGVNPLGNTGSGVYLGSGVSGTIIGGTEANSGNTIAFNNQGGITLAPSAGTGNLIDPNKIFGNTGLGIDLGEDGITLNDPHDPDTGPNNLQNYPAIVSKQIVNDELIVNFLVDSAPENSVYGTNGIRVEFFKADDSGEGERFLGTANYTVADYNNGSPNTKTVNLGNINTLGITASDLITSTATDADGNSSEFTPAFAPTAAAVSISGRVFAADRGLPRAFVVMTDSNGVQRTAQTNSFGYYRFENVQAGETYVFGVKSKQYSFATQVVNVTDNLTALNFTAQKNSNQKPAQ